MPQGKFNRALLDAIEGGLSSLGDSPREGISYHLETSFRLKKENIRLNLSEFWQALEGIFGPGSLYLEKLIVTCLYEGLGPCFEGSEHVDFGLRQRCEEASHAPRGGETVWIKP